MDSSADFVVVDLRHLEAGRFGSKPLFSSKRVAVEEYSWYSALLTGMHG